MRERFALIEKVPGTFRLVAKKITEVWSDLPCEEVLFGHAESWEIIEGKINAVFAEIDRDVLPEIR